MRLICLPALLLLVTSLAAQQPDTLLHSIPAPPVGAQVEAQLGYSVAVDGGYTVVGAPYDDIGGADSGVVKVFDSATGALLFLLNNPSPAAADRFGNSVAISGARVVVGAFLDDTGASNAGSVYVYDLSSGTPTVPVATLNNPSPAASDWFGSRVAISGTRVVVGTIRDDTGASDAGSAYVYDLSSGTPTVPVATLNNPSPAADDRFGSSVAISGTDLVVGAYGDYTGAYKTGRAYVYDLSSGTPAVPLVVLNNPILADRDFFGFSVAISGTRVVVGVYQDDTGASNAGSAHVYDLSSGTPTVPVATLNNPSPAVDDYFGYSVAISGTRVVVGAHQDYTGAISTGSAYVYDLSSGTPTVPVATLNNPSPAADDRFGSSVAISGTRVVVGAYLDDTGANNAGSAYVYDLSSGTPTVPVATLNNPSPAGYDHFGCSVAISGTRVVVGAQLDDTGATNTGSAYVYDLSSGTPTVPVATLNNPSPGSGDFFGYSVAISGNLLVVVAESDDTGLGSEGSAYVYDLSSGTPTVPMATLNSPSPAPEDRFGFSVAVSGTWVVVGTMRDDTGASDAGSAYVYDLSSGTPTVPVATLNNPSPAGSDQFGWSVAISGPHVVVGAIGDDTGATDAGSAYVYDLSSGTPTVPVATLNNPGPAQDDRFGWSVGISGTRVVVGRIWDDTGASDAGSAFVYDLSSGTPTVPVATLNNPSPAASDWFGSRVAISGTRVVVGTMRDDTGASDAGSAYVYDLSSGTPTVPVATLNNPGPADGDLFGSSVAIDGTTVAIGTPYDDSVVTDKGHAYVFGAVDTITDLPKLSCPAASTTTTTPISVSFTLPEAASPGSVKLSFGATQLTLASSQETAGVHSFTFDPANPTASPEIASGSPIVDGSYTVTLIYQDREENPAASVSSPNVTVDTTAPTGGSMTLSPASPMARGGPLTVTFAGWVDDRSPLSYEVFIDGVVVSSAGSAAIIQLRAPSSATGPTSYSLKGRIRDTLGNTTEVTQTIDVFLTPGQQQFSADMLSAGLPGPEVAAASSPQNDGVTNLEKYAFNLDLLSRDNRILTPGTGTAGLPVITFPSAGVMRVEYLRRIGSGLVYTPKKGTSPQAGSWQTLSAPGVVTPIDANWERVQHDESFTPSSTPAMYGTVEVTLP